MKGRILVCVVLVLSMASCDHRTVERRQEQTVPTAVQTGADARPNGDITRRAVGIDGVTLSILEGGLGDPVVFVHGVVTTNNIFPSYLKAYTPGYRGIAVDLRGYGDSEKPETGFTISQFSKDLIALADALHLQKPVWVGVS